MRIMCFHRPECCATRAHSLRYPHPAFPKIARALKANGSVEFAHAIRMSSARTPTDPSKTRLNSSLLSAKHSCSAWLRRGAMSGWYGSGSHSVFVTGRCCFTTGAKGLLGQKRGVKLDAKRCCSSCTAMRASRSLLHRRPMLAHIATGQVLCTPIGCPEAADNGIAKLVGLK